MLAEYMSKLKLQHLIKEIYSDDYVKPVPKRTSLKTEEQNFRIGKVILKIYDDDDLDNKEAVIMLGPGKQMWLTLQELKVLKSLINKATI